MFKLWGKPNESESIHTVFSFTNQAQLECRWPMEAGHSGDGSVPRSVVDFLTKISSTLGLHEIQNMSGALIIDKPRPGALSSKARSLLVSSPC